MIEREVKIRINDPEKIRVKLNSLAVPTKAFERNTVFDDNDSTLRKTDKLLRLRDNGRFILTFKGPRKITSFKEREETEVEVSDLCMMKTILEGAGIFAVKTYEKERETWHLGDCEAMLDLLPRIGYFLEIEGSEESIIALARKIGFSEKDFITKNYFELYEEHCRMEGIECKDMVFE